MNELFPKSAAVVSNTGLKRKENQDIALLAGEYIRDNTIVLKECTVSYPFIAAVADGMGGHAAGEVASEIALKGLEITINNLLPETWGNEQRTSERITEIITDLHHEILDISRENLKMEKMGTTLTGIVIGDPGNIYMFHVGDTRLYHFHKGDLNQLTRDHAIKREKSIRFSSNALVNSIGGGLDKFYVDFQQISEKIHSGDLLLLSSDGLHDIVPDDELAEVLKSDTSLEEKAQLLLHKALDGGGYDNITLVLLAF